MHGKPFPHLLSDYRLSPLYQSTISMLTRERAWQSALVEKIDPQPRDVILDWGCGAGAMAILLKQACPSASIYAVDPEPTLLTRAEAEARDKDLLIHFSLSQTGATARVASGIYPAKIVSALMMQDPRAGKRSLIQGAFATLPDGGTFQAADFAPQTSPMMNIAIRQARILMQIADEGDTPTLMREAGFTNICETAVIPTPAGTISLYAAVRPPASGARKW